MNIYKYNLIIIYIYIYRVIINYNWNIIFKYSMISRTNIFGLEYLWDWLSHL